MRLSLITLVVPDYDPAIAFFVQGLGFTLTADEDQTRKRWVTVAPPGGGAEILLARASDAEQTRTIGNQTAGRVGFFLTTEDFKGDAAKIERAGGRFIEEPRSEPYGIVAQWRDPWGNLWDLVEPLS